MEDLYQNKNLASHTFSGIQWSYCVKVSLDCYWTWLLHGCCVDCRVLLKFNHVPDLLLVHRKKFQDFRKFRLAIQDNLIFASYFRNTIHNQLHKFRENFSLGSSESTLYHLYFCIPERFKPVNKFHVCSDRILCLEKSQLENRGRKVKNSTWSKWCKQVFHKLQHPKRGADSNKDVDSHYWNFRV